MRDSSLACIDLLYSSIRRHNNKEESDFLIVANNNRVDASPHNVVVDLSFPSQYPGFLKYSPKIPAGYDYYLYLDSDILFEESVQQLIPKENRIACVVIESNTPMMQSDWHRHPHMSGGDYPCLNAGQFGFRCVSFLKLVCDEFDFKLVSHASALECAKHEQSSFNFACSKKWDSLDFDLLTNRVSIAPERDPNKPILHFTAFGNDMIHKYQRMLLFMANRKGNT